MTAREFLADQLGHLVLWFGTMAGTAAFFLVTGTQGGVLILAGIVWTLLLAVELLAGFLRCQAHLRELESIMDHLDQKYLFAECMPKPGNLYECRLQNLMRRSGKAMIESVSAARTAQSEYREYIESWVHEIKTPMTAAHLLCHGASPELRRKISRELAQIDNHVERALFYARAESPEKDFMIRRTSLAEIVSQAIGQHQALLIESGVRIDTGDFDYTVYTDVKWAAFLLGQLLQNAVRYRSADPVITLAAGQAGSQVQLLVQDNGIGIPSFELSRVFDRGFTGSNGRLRGGSTGIGLYLCRKLSAFLQVGLEIKSEEGQGTLLVMTFPAKENLSKV